MNILSVDPGKNVGMALWSPKGVLMMNQAMKFDDALSFIAQYDDLDTIVYEDFQLYADRAAPKGSRFEASQIIGAIKLWVLQERGRTIVKQPSSILPVSALHVGVVLPKGHVPDDLSAMLHGHYYLVEQGVLQPHSVVVE